MARRPYDPLDYHDPTAGIAGAPPARSALTLRLVLALLGLLTCGPGALGFLALGEPGWAVGFGLLALVAAVDAVVIVRRMRIERGLTSASSGAGRAGAGGRTTR